jgi:uroporphyrinogen-III synthase
LIQKGIETLIIPFLEISRVNYQKLRISQSDYIMFTSKNAANFFRFENQFRNNSVFSVGRETKKILQEKGFQNIINADENLEKLLTLLKKKLKKGDVIIHPTYKKLNPKIRNFFLSLGCKYFAVKCYSSKMICRNNDKLILFMKNTKKSMIAFYSPLTARSFVKQIQKMNLIKFCKNKSFIVISNKVKEEINKLGKLSIYVARKPNQKEMIDIMKEKFTLGKKIG